MKQQVNETAIIQDFSSASINITRNLPSVEYLRKRLVYDPDTGVLTWRERYDIPNYEAWNGRYAGKVAGYVWKGRRVAITFDNRKLYAHRVAWKMFYGEEPPALIDHISGDAKDNRIVNLREATNMENQMNTRKRDIKGSRFKGVDFMKSKNKWRATITRNKTRKHLGVFDCEADAAKAYQIAAAEMFGEFARFE